MAQGTGASNNNFTNASNLSRLWRVITLIHIFFFDCYLCRCQTLRTFSFNLLNGLVVMKTTSFLNILFLTICFLTIMFSLEFIQSITKTALHNHLL